MSSTTTAHGDALRVLFSVFIIAESDSRNIECLQKMVTETITNGYWLQKISLEQLLFE